jgi:hypothetical protein
MTEKMILVSEEEWLQKNKSMQIKTSFDTIEELEKHICTLIDSNDIPSYTKNNLIQHLQNRINKIQIANEIDENIITPNIEDVNNKIIREKIIKNISKHNTKKSNQLLDFMTSNFKDIGWNNKYELTIDNIGIKHTNIIDLIHFLFSNKSQIDLHGLVDLAKVFHKLKLPTHYIVNNKVKYFLENGYFEKHKKIKTDLRWEEN